MKGAPRSKLARAAHKLVESTLSPVYFRHSLRSFGCAQAFARERKLEYDEEGLYVAFLFHDLGLFPPVRDRKQPFQVVSSLAMREFLEKRDFAPERIAPLVAAIDYHVQPVPRWSLSTEAGLLHVGAWMDALFLRRWTVPADAARLEKELPRGAFLREAFSLVTRSVGSPSALFGMLMPDWCRAKPSA